MSWKRSLLATLIAIGLHGTANCAVLYFDAATSTTWDNGATSNWGAASGGPYNTNAWAPGDAVFEGTAGTVNVSETIAGVQSLSFTMPNYIITGSTLTLTGSGTIDSPGANTIASVLGGNAGLTKSGDGVLTLSGANNYTGVTTISAGTLKLGNATALGAIGASNGTTINSGATLDVNAQSLQSELITVAGTITNTGGTASNALRNITLAGDAVFTGTGRWDIRGGSAVLDTAGFKVSKTGTNKIAFIDGTISGGGTIEISAGTFTVTRSVMTTGAINVLGGTFEFENNSAAHNYAVPLALTGGKISSGGADGTTYAGPIALTGIRDIDVVSNMLRLSGPISGVGGIRKLGPGTLIITNNANTYSGALMKTELSVGILAVAPSAVVGDGTNELDLRSSTANPIVLRSLDANPLTLGNFINISSNVTLGTATTGSIIFNGGAAGGGGAKALTVDAARVAFNGVVSGNTSEFTKLGLGVLEFNNAGNTFTKPVIVNAGGLGGTGRIPGAVTINTAGALLPGSSIGTLNITNTLTLGGTALFELDASLAGLNSSDRVIGVTTLTYGGELRATALSGTLTAGQSWNLFDFATSSGTFFSNDSVFGTAGDGVTLPTLAAGTWQFDYGTGVLSITAVPEPGTVGIVLAALTGVLLVRSRRRV